LLVTLLFFLLLIILLLPVEAVAHITLVVVAVQAD
jgi:hypothetical protein